VCERKGPTSKVIKEAFADYHTITEQYQHSGNFLIAHPIFLLSVAVAANINIPLIVVNVQC
jgi:hypothetical protein